MPIDRSQLLAFAEEAAVRCRALGFDPIAYGSLALAVHVENTATPLSDIDLLAPEALFTQLARDWLPGTTATHTNYHSLKLERGELKVSCDSVDHYLAGLTIEPVAAEVEGHVFLILDRAALIQVYRRGADTIAIKRADYLTKLARLQA